MRIVHGICIGMFIGWVIVLVWYVGTLRHRPKTPTPRRTRPPYAESLERLSAAVAGAHRETEPGAPSPDLAKCWEIWPDAPLNNRRKGR